MIRYDMIWWNNEVFKWWYDMIRYNMMWYDIVWEDMIWYDMIWYCDDKLQWSMHHTKIGMAHG